MRAPHRSPVRGCRLFPVLALAFIAAPFAVCPTRAALLFGAPQYWPAGDGPTAVALLDTDLDGALDVVTSNAGANTIAVLAGDGAGAFLPPLMFPTGTYPVALAVADFDADGDLDAVTADSLGNTASVLFGAAGAAFEAPMSWPTGARPAAVAVTTGFWGVAPGIVTANADGTITHYEGDGTRNFFWRTDAPAGPSPGGVVAYDFNRDGLTDVVAANADPAVDPGQITLLTAQYEFYERYFYFVADALPNPAAPEALLIAEVTANGWYDLVVVSRSGNAGTLSLRPGDGRTPFGPAVDVPLPAPASCLAAADVDGDQDMDVVAAGPTGAVMLLVNHGGALMLDGVIDLGEAIASVAVGDVDQDGWADLVLGLRGSDRVAVLRGGTALAATDGPHGAPPARLVVTPRPARASAEILLRAAGVGDVRVEVLDAAGRLLRVLHAGPAPGGEVRCRWDLRGENGARAASGTYFIRALDAGGDPLVEKIAVLR